MILKKTQVMLRHPQTDEWVPVEVLGDSGQEAINRWLEEHPEATTTVQNGSISKSKLTKDVLSGLTGSPQTASTLSEMTDTKKVYVYTGSESGMVYGNWYYHDGTEWQSGGVYNSVAFDTDATLSISGAAADALSVGEQIDLIYQGFTSELEVDSEGLVYLINAVGERIAGPYGPFAGGGGGGGNSGTTDGDAAPNGKGGTTTLTRGQVARNAAAARTAGQITASEYDAVIRSLH